MDAMLVVVSLDWFQAAAVQIAIASAMSDGMIRVCRALLDEWPSSPDATAPILDLFLWGVARRQSPQWLRWLQAWPACDALRHIRRLHLTDCDMGTSSVAALVPFLSQLATLRELRLDHNTVSAADPTLPVPGWGRKSFSPPTGPVP